MFRPDSPRLEAGVSRERRLGIRHLISESFTEAAVLPERVFCDACGAILYDGSELESPIEIIQRYNGTCPKCQKTLSYDVDRVEILPYDENLIRSKAKHKWAL